MERAIKGAGLKRLAKKYGPKRAGHGDEERVLQEALRRAQESNLRPSGALEEADEYLNSEGVMSFGVEVLPYESSGPLRDQEAFYLNAGDTYVPTLMYTDAEGFFISSWGDWLEDAELRHEEEYGERRCPYCGTWSEEIAGEDGECPSCGSDVHGQRPSERRGQQEALDAGGGEDLLVDRMMDAVQPVIEEYLGGFEYSRTEGPPQAVWDALDTVKSALQKLSGEYVRRNL